MRLAGKGDGWVGPVIKTAQAGHTSWFWTVQETGSLKKDGETTGLVGLQIHLCIRQGSLSQSAGQSTIRAHVSHGDNSVTSLVTVASGPQHDFSRRLSLPGALRYPPSQPSCIRTAHARSNTNATRRCPPALHTPARNYWYPRRLERNQLASRRNRCILRWGDHVRMQVGGGRAAPRSWDPGLLRRR